MNKGIKWAVALLAAFPAVGHCENKIDLGLGLLSFKSETPSVPLTIDTDGPQVFVNGRTDFGVLPVFFGYDISYAATDGDAGGVAIDLDLMQIRTGVGKAIKFGDAGEAYARADFTHYGAEMTNTATGISASDNNDGLGLHLGGTMPLGSTHVFADAGYLELSEGTGPEAQIGLRGNYGGLGLMAALRYTKLSDDSAGVDTDTDIIDLRVGLAIGGWRRDP